MSYLVLARKYRPNTFSEVIGQAAIAKTLENALRGGRTAHAYLFTGPRGVGKTSMARILAKALRCQNAPTPTPCNECDFCLAVSRGNDLDVIEIDGASNRGIENIRDLRENVRYLPTQGKTKVYIVDEVHQITQDGFNAFLKTLEEPPEHVVFVFATTEPGKVPETIRSRCQEFEFRRIPEAAIVAHIGHLAELESLQIETGMELEIARRARGGLRDALSLLDQLAAFGDGCVTFEGFRELTGFVAPDRVRLLFDAIEQGNLDRSLDWVSEALHHGATAADLLDTILDYCRGLLHRLAQSRKAPGMPGVDEASLKRQLEQWDEGQLLGLMQVALQTKRVLRDLDDEHLALDMFVTEMLRVSELPELTAVLEGWSGDVSSPPAEPPGRKTSSLARPGAGTAKPAVAAASADTTAVASAVSTGQTGPEAPPGATGPAADSAQSSKAAQASDPAVVFDLLQRKLVQQHPSLLVVLRKMTPVAIADGNLWVTASHPSAARELNGERLLTSVRKITREEFGISLGLRLQGDEPSKPKRRDPSKDQTIDEIRKRFGGETVSE